MMLALLKKDLRQNRIPTLGMVIIFLLPPILYTLMYICEPDYGRDGWRFELIKGDLEHIIIIMGVATLLVVPAFASVAMAKERRERTCDFVSALPIERHIHIASKLIVSLTLSLLPWILVGILVLSAYQADMFRWLGGPKFDSRPILLLVELFVALYGAAWFFGSFLKSETIAAVFAIAIVITILAAVPLAINRIVVSDESTEELVWRWFAFLFWPLGIVGFVAGTILALKRKAW